MSTKATLRAASAVLAFFAVSAALSYRILDHMVIDGHPELERWGLADFREAIYYPVRALLDGNNPYDAPRYTSTYPVGVVFPTYSPIALLLYSPFGLLKFETGAIVFLLLNIALTPVLAWLALRICGLAATVAQTFLLATLILLSRGGYVNMFLGQCTIYVALATYAALHFGNRRPWLAGLALAFTTLKPTFGGPLAVLMLARRDVRPVLIGIGVALAGALIPATILAHDAGGIHPFFASLATTYASFESAPSINAASAPLRVDSAALVGRLVGASVAGRAEYAITLAILGLGALAVWRLAANEDAATRRLSASLVCLTILTCIYQQVYSLVLLTLPLTALATGQWGRRGSTWQAVRWPLLILVAIPMSNYCMSRSALEFVGIDSLRLSSGWVLALASVNGAAVLLALSVCVVLAFSPAGRASGAAGKSSASSVLQLADQVPSRRPERRASQPLAEAPR